MVQSIYLADAVEPMDLWENTFEYLNIVVTIMPEG